MEKNSVLHNFLSNKFVTFFSFFFLAGVTELETICQFGCLSLITHYMLFMTFFPACLSLFLEV